MMHSTPSSAWSFKKFICYILLFTFYFQTLWPSVCFAKIEVALGTPWQENQGGLTFKAQYFKDPHTARDLVRIEAFAKPEQQPQKTKPILVSPSKPPSSSSQIPEDLNKKDKSFPSSSSTASSPSTSSTASATSSAAETDPLDGVKKLLDRVVDIKTLSPLASGYSAYNDLVIKEEGIGWAFAGVSFVLDWQGNLVTTGTAGFDMALNLRTWGKVGLDNVSVKQVLAQATEVTLRGTGKIDRLDVWALSKPRVAGSGMFRITDGSSQEINQLYLHQGTGINQGQLDIKESFETVEDFNNIGILQAHKNAKINGKAIFNNTGTVEGESYSLHSSIIKNQSKDAKTGIIRSSTTLHLQATTLDQQGLIEGKSKISFGVDDLNSHQTSTIKTPTLQTKINKVWHQRGKLETHDWQDSSVDTAKINNTGIITSTQKTTLGGQFYNLSSGQADLTHLTLANQRQASQPLVNEGQMTLRNVQSLGTAHKTIDNKAGAKLLFMGHSYRQGWNNKNLPTSNSLRLNLQAVASTEGLHLGSVTNAGTIGFGQGTYTLHGTFKNHLGSTYEILPGQDLWQQDLVNHGLIQAFHGYRLDQSQGIFTKTGTIKVKGQMVTKFSTAALQQHNRSNTWTHTGHLEADKWLDESEGYLTLENKGTLISRKKTDLGLMFTNSKDGTADLTGLSLNNRYESGLMFNHGKLTLRQVRSLGKGIRDIWNCHSATLSFLESGYLKSQRLHLGEVTNYGHISFGGGKYQTKIFYNKNVHHVLPGHLLKSEDFINDGKTKVHTPHYLIDMKKRVFSNLGVVKAKQGSVRIEFPENSNAAEYLRQVPLDQWKIKNNLIIWAPYFHNTQNFGLGIPIHMWIGSFKNDALFHTYGLSLKARRFAQGSLGGVLGEMKSSGDLDIEIEGDVDNQRGKIEAEGEGQVTSTDGTIFVGQGIGYGYRQKNGAFIMAHKKLKVKGKNINLSFGEVVSKQAVDILFENNLTLESSLIRSGHKMVFQGPRADITRAAPYTQQLASSDFYNNWAQYDGGDASQVQSGMGINFLVDQLYVTASNITAMGHVTDKFGKRCTADHPGYFVLNAMHYYKTESKKPGDKYPDHKHYVYDSRYPNFSTSGNIDMNYSQYQLNALITAASIIMGGDHFNLGNGQGKPLSGTATYGYLSLLSKVLSMTGGSTQYRSMIENPYVVYSTGSFITNRIDPALLTLVKDSMATLSFMADPAADPRFLRFLTDQEGLIWALQQTLLEATRKSYLFPRKNGMEHLITLLKNAVTAKAGRPNLTSQDMEKSTLPLLTHEQETIQGEVVNVPYVFIPKDFINNHLFEPSYGTLGADEGITVNMRQFLGQTGGIFSTDKNNIKLSSQGNMNLGAAAHRTGGSKNYSETRVGGAHYAPQGTFTAKAKNDLNRKGLTVEARDGIGFAAKGKGKDEALPIQSLYTTELEDGKKVVHKVTHYPSTYKTEGNFTETFGGDLHTYAQQVKAQEHHTTAARVTEHPVHDTIHETTTQKQKGSWFGGGSEKKEEKSEITSKGAKITAQKRTIITTQGTIISIGVDYQVPEVIFKAANGVVQLLARTNQHFYNNFEKNADTFQTTVTQSGHTQVNYIPCSFSHGLTIEGHHIDIQKIKGETLKWVDKLTLDNDAILDIHDLTPIFQSYHHESSSISPALSAIIALGVGALTCGTGAAMWAGSQAALAVGATSAMSSAVVSGMGAAVFTTLCVEAAQAFIQHEGNIGKAATHLTSSKSLKAMTIAAASAGLTQGLAQQFNIKFVPGTANTVSEHFQKEALRQSVTASLRMATGSDAKQALELGIRGTIAGVAGGLMANQISAMKQDREISAATHKLLHGLSGAAGGAIINNGETTADSALAGAMGAVTAEIVAEAIGDTKTVIAQRVEAKAIEQGIDLNDQEALNPLICNEMAKTISISALGAGIAALLAGKDVDTAAQTGTTAVENNNLKLLYKGIKALVDSSVKTAAKEEAKQIGKQTVKEVGKKLPKDLKNYVREIESKTGGKVCDKQKDMLAQDLRQNKYTKLTPEQKAAHSEKFNKTVKDNLISEWEKQTGKDWPKYRKLDPQGKQLYNRTTGEELYERYHAHHINPQQMGGKHEWWNIFPAHKDVHTGQGGLHSSASTLNKILKEINK